MDVDEDLPLVNQTSSAGATTPLDSQDASKSGSAVHMLLHSIITPSPYPHHNAGPTSARFRNALSRVLQRPEHDVEAWQALLTEVTTCYKNIPNIHAVDATTLAQLDWVESCFGNFLCHFPYAIHQGIVPLVTLLLHQSARVGEPHGPVVDYYGGAVPKRAQICERKCTALLQEYLGVANKTSGLSDPAAAGAGSEENDKSKTIIHAMGSWVVELWLVYIQKCTRDATRHSQTLPPEQRAAYIRDQTKEAYEAAIPECGFSINNHLLWTAYLEFSQSEYSPNQFSAGTAEHAAASQAQMVQLRSVYQRLVTYPMTGLDQHWHAYEAWERTQSEALAQALSQEWTPKYQHARTVYLERNRVYNNQVELQVGQRLATPPADAKDEDDYESKIQEELRLLTAWKKRCSYERTNPERLGSQELIVRIRAAFKEMVCVLTKHPETWQMWATYELFRNHSGNGNGVSAVATPQEAVAVLHLGQVWIPTSTLLVYEEARIVELYTASPETALGVMERALERLPTTLGFVLYQQMVRRYRGMDDARVVFSKARRVLKGVDNDRNKKGSDDDAGEAEASGKLKAEGETGDSVLSENATDPAPKEKSGGLRKSRWTVTNKLDSTATNQADSNGTKESSTQKVHAVGRITWHLYAAHAGMEHRINRCPEIAARVYELGLRKHRHFLTRAAYVMRYAELLLEIGDVMNLRALLTRAVSACEGSPSAATSLASLWDMTLRFEAVLSGSDPKSLANLSIIERQRRQAILGPDVEDVATGGFIGMTDTPLIGAQKSSIAEQLLRTEGYDMSSGIVNGLARTVNVLEVMGLWGNGEQRIAGKVASKDSKGDSDDMPGGNSDSSYHRRLEFASLLSSAGGAGLDPAVTASADGGSRLLTARERLQHSATNAGGPGAGGPANSAIMLAIQQMPEWIRPLLVMLPASRLRLPIVAKPPPHLVEIALSTLKQNQLPDRPSDEKNGSGMNGSKRKSGEDSSDDESGAVGGGFGNAFRARQRSRMAAAGTLQ